MRTIVQKETLSEAELDRIGEFLKNSKAGKIVNIEELDGFFAALVAGPELVMPSEYLPEVLGGGMYGTHEFDSIEEANEILALMMRHWNKIAATLEKGEPYLPVLLEDEDGVAHGNDWARGFMRGVEMRREGWGDLLDDEDHGGCMVPMLALYHEQDEDPTMCPDPIGPEQREKMIVHMVAGLVQAYRYFREHRQPLASGPVFQTRQSSGKVGRNDPCPCGSGKKYKRCCGGVTIH